MAEIKNVTDLANEIYKREKEKGREVDFAKIKNVLRTVADLMAENWVLNYNLQVAEALRRNGLGRLKKKK